jgi:hypothetical protein
VAAEAAAGRAAMIELPPVNTAKLRPILRRSSEAPSMVNTLEKTAVLEFSVRCSYLRSSRGANLSPSFSMYPLLNARLGRRVPGPGCFEELPTRPCSWPLWRRTTALRLRTSYEGRREHNSGRGGGHRAPAHREVVGDFPYGEAVKVGVALALAQG